jgi:hypothetical protein
VYSKVEVKGRSRETIIATIVEYANRYIREQKMNKHNKTSPKVLSLDS